MRKKIAAANWKMNLTLSEAQGLASEIINMYRDEFLKGPTVVIAPPFPYLGAVKNLMDATPEIYLSAQNVHTELKGAFTGEVSAPMLVSMGCRYCIIGHSERRQYFSESDQDVLTKAKILFANGIKPILCVGEKLEQREAGDAFKVVEAQLRGGLFELVDEEVAETVIAYEPVWAIGTGITATPEQAQEMHAFIRGLVAERIGKEKADGISILYGGSVNSGNAGALFSQPDIDGGLVGGASLKSREFIEIMKNL